MYLLKEMKDERLIFGPFHAVISTAECVCIACKRDWKIISDKYVRNLKALVVAYFEGVTSALAS
jgi:hypothetical protein